VHPQVDGKFRWTTKAGFGKTSPWNKLCWCKAATLGRKN
jgi:hypothetical protein